MKMKKTDINNYSTYINSIRILYCNAYVGNIIKLKAFNG